MGHSHIIIYINAVSIVLLHTFMVVLSNYVEIKMTPVPSVGLWDMGHVASMNLSVYIGLHVVMGVLSNYVKFKMSLVPSAG